jgi:CBS domain containing-hemolysin-like protein
MGSLLLRSAAVVEDAHALGANDDVARRNRLRGSYIAILITSGLAAVSLVAASHASLGAPGAMLAVLIVPVLFVATELLPRALAGADSGARRWGGFVGRVVAPIERILAGRDAQAWSHAGLAALVRTVSAEEADAERHMANRVYEFADITVGDIMVPLINVSALRDDLPIDEIVRTATREGFSRFPVYHDRLPNVVGMLHVFDLLAPGEARTAADLMDHPTFVPEMAPASQVLRRLQAEGVNLAVVVDEYGGAVGIIAIEDILEEVVGQIEDEYDVQEEPVRQQEPGRYLVDARAEIDTLNERFAWQLPEGEYETLGGLLLARLARIPAMGETMDLEKVRLRVTEASSRAVEQVAVEEKGEGA